MTDDLHQPFSPTDAAEFGEACVNQQTILNGVLATQPVLNGMPVVNSRVLVAPLLNSAAWIATGALVEHRDRATRRAARREFVRLAEAAFDEYDRRIDAFGAAEFVTMAAEEFEALRQARAEGSS